MTVNIGGTVVIVECNEPVDDIFVLDWYFDTHCVMPRDQTKSFVKHDLTCMYFVSTTSRLDSVDSSCSHMEVMYVLAKRKIWEGGNKTAGYFVRPGFLTASLLQQK